MALTLTYPVICFPDPVANDPTGLCTVPSSFAGNHNPLSNGTNTYLVTSGEDAALIDAFLACGGVAGCFPSVVTPPVIDYVDLGAIWTFGFVTVLMLWLVAKNAGIIVNAVRRF
jgi:hypothetical protein